MCMIFLYRKPNIAIVTSEWLVVLYQDLVFVKGKIMLEVN